MLLSLTERERLKTELDAPSGVNPGALAGNRARDNKRGALQQLKCG